MTKKKIPVTKPKTKKASKSTTTEIKTFNVYNAKGLTFLKECLEELSNKTNCSKRLSRIHSYISELSLKGKPKDVVAQSSVGNLIRLFAENNPQHEVTKLDIEMLLKAKILTSSKKIAEYFSENFTHFQACYIGKLKSGKASINYNTKNS
jgi:hypothetical protein